jgi:hypothetical protein
MEEFLASIKSSNDPRHAMELVQISASFCLPSTPKLAERVLQAFELSEEQKYDYVVDFSCVSNSFWHQMSYVLVPFPM